MKTASPALISYLTSLRGSRDAQLYMADCFTITLSSGSIGGLADGTSLLYTTIDVPVLLNGSTYLAGFLQISGLIYKASLGPSVDEQQITISAPQTSTIWGLPFMQVIQNGLLDGAEVQRDRVFFTDFSGTPPISPIGSLLLFRGRVTSVDSVGRTTAQIKVASDLTLLTVGMPRRCFQTNCLHTLYDDGCRVDRAAHTFSGVVQSGSSDRAIAWSGATVAMQQGSMEFTGGANVGITVNVQSANSSGLTLSYPLPHVPAVGDSFTVSHGCDHSMSTCTSRFSNIANFVGFPFMPPPEIITGPLSRTGPTNTK
jgi:uncharacterized phage protein (TIGR02218 family)